MKSMPGIELAAAAVLTAPALFSAALGDLPVDVALTRYLVAVAVCWALLWVAVELLWATPASPATAGGASTGSAGVPGDPVAQDPRGVLADETAETAEPARSASSGGAEAG